MDKQLRRGLFAFFATVAALISFSNVRLASGNGLFRIVAGLVVFSFFHQIVRIGRWAPATIQDRPRPRRHVVKPGGNWEGAPVPEIDKSTTGQLLAGRVRRNPEIQVRSYTPDPSRPDPGPARLDELWDRELDG